MGDVGETGRSGVSQSWLGGDMMVVLGVKPRRRKGQSKQISLDRCKAGDKSMDAYKHENVEKFLVTLDSISATGPDGISSLVLKMCSTALAHPLSALFTLSFTRGHIPCA